MPLSIRKVSSATTMQGVVRICWLQLTLLSTGFHAMTVAGSTNPAATSLDDLHWQRRVIVAFTEPGTLHEQDIRQWVGDNQCALDERDTDLFLITDGNARDATDASRQLDGASLKRLAGSRQRAAGDLELLLIGKDGGIKAHATEVIQLDEFLHLIDGMPMRRAESAKGQGNCR